MHGIARSLSLTHTHLYTHLVYADYLCTHSLSLSHTHTHTHTLTHTYTQGMAPEAVYGEESAHAQPHGALR